MVTQMTFAGRYQSDEKSRKPMTFWDHPEKGKTIFSKRRFCHTFFLSFLFSVPENK